jgi:hypothetical protein
MTGLPFEISRHMQDGRWTERARFVCARCEGKAEFPLIRQSRAFNPEATIKNAAAAGWSVKHGSTRAECPRCVRERSQRAKGESPGPKAEVIMLQPVPKPLTGDQRLRIRALLDKHFDDSAGRYLDGYSDHRIAEELKLPRVHVETIREAAYGAIRVSPEMEAAEKAVAALEARMQPAEKVIAEVERLLKEARALVEAARKALAA